MANITEKIERRITALEGKIDALSGNYLTNTWKRQREQQERDRKKEMYRSQIQVLQLLKHKPLPSFRIVFTEPSVHGGQLPVP